MSEEKFAETQVIAVRMIFQFLMDRIEECPAFTHILDQCFTKIFIDAKKFAKNESHHCCDKVFLKSDTDTKTFFEEIFLTQQGHEKVCSCTCLDLTMQTNNLLDSATKPIVYKFLFLMF